MNLRFFLSWFASGSRKQDSQWVKTFILEPILTPIALVDGEEDTPDPALVELPDDGDDGEAVKLAAEMEFDGGGEADLAVDVTENLVDGEAIEEGEEISFVDPGEESVELDTDTEGNVEVESEGEETIASDPEPEETAIVLEEKDATEDSNTDEPVAESTDDSSEDIEQEENDDTVEETVVEEGGDSADETVEENSDRPVDETVTDEGDNATKDIVEESSDRPTGEADTSSNETEETETAIADSSSESDPETEETIETEENAIDSDTEDDLSQEAIAKTIEFTSGTFTADESGQIGVEFVYDGGAYQGEVALFSLEGMEQFGDGNSIEFIREAARRAASNSELGQVVISDGTEGAKILDSLENNNWNSGEYKGIKTVTLRSGDRFAFMLVPNGTVQKVLDNPEIGNAGRPLFSLATANPDDGLHLGQIADVKGDGSTFVWEDQRIDLGTDRDYNDLIFRVTGAKGEAISLDEVIDANKDWRRQDKFQDLVRQILGEEDAIDDNISDNTSEENSDTGSDTTEESGDEAEDSQSEETETENETTDTETESSEDNNDSDTTEEPPAEPISVAQPVLTVEVSPGSPGVNFDLGEVFGEFTKQIENNAIDYEVLDVPDSIPTPEIDNTNLTFDTSKVTEEVTAIVRAFDEAGNEAIQTIAIAINPVTTEAIAETQESINAIADFIDIDRNWEELSPDEIVELDTQLDRLFDDAVTTLGNNPEVVDAILQGKDLQDLGFDETASELIENAIADPEFAKEFGFSVPITEAFNSDIPGAWDLQLLNAETAASLVTAGSELPSVTVLDFVGEHSEAVENTIALVNPNLDADFVAINPGGETASNWAQQLIETVDRLKSEGETQAIVNLSFDLTQLDDVGVTTRYELTEFEREALTYAQENNILLVVASGNTGDKMSALGESTADFDNIITVGAVDPRSQVADYSSRGAGLTLVAPGGKFDDDPSAFVGTSRATAYVTGAASLVWAANPELSYQQVKELLVNSAVDLGVEGWDPETGAGLLDVTEAVMAAGLVVPEEVKRYTTTDSETGINGTGRVISLVRAAFGSTQEAIAALQSQQAALTAQLLGTDGRSALQTDPNLTLEELQARVGAAEIAGLDAYRQLDVSVEKVRSEANQLAEALSFAAQQAEIERSRLQQLETRRQTLVEELAALTQEKVQLETANPQQLAQIEAAIAQTEEAIATAKEKLKYQLVDPETLASDPAAVREAAAQQRELAAEYRQEAAEYAAERDGFQAKADAFEAEKQRNLDLAAALPTYRYKLGKCGWYKQYNPYQSQYQQYQNNAKAAALNAQREQYQADIANQNYTFVDALAKQIEQQASDLEQHAQHLEQQQAIVSTNSGTPEEAKALLESLQKQAEEQAQLAEAYVAQALEAEKRRKQNLDKYNHHKSRAVTVTYNKHWKKFRKCGAKPYTYTYRPEHYEPRDLAHKELQIATQEVSQFDELAREAQAKAQALKTEAEFLAQRIEDWPSIKQGIEYEIQANKLKKQAEEDLLDLQKPIQRQQMETLDLKIEQAENAIADLDSQLPEQTNKANSSEARLETLQAEFDAIRKALTEAQRNRQTFLETEGFFLPQDERKAAIAQQISDLREAEVAVQEQVVALAQQYSQQPSDAIAQQLQEAQNYTKQLQQEREWAEGWQDQLALVTPDAPQQLKLGELIRKLDQRQASSSDFNTLPIADYLAVLNDIREEQNNITSGFANAAEKLKDAEAARSVADTKLVTLQDNYRQLGIDRDEIEADKALSNHIDVIDAEIDEAKTTLQGYQNQISEANNRVSELETKRAQAQNNANYWHPRIWTKHQSKYGTTTQHNPHAEAEYKKAQTAANSYAAQRDEAQVEANTLSASLQPDIAIAEQNISDLETRKTRWEELGETQLEDAIATLKTEGDDTTILEQRLQDIDDRLATQDDKLANKYTEIELTEDYLTQLDRQVDRLEHRRDLLAAADNLEQQYQTQETTWNAATQAQTLATQTLLATRDVGASDRAQLATLQTELNTVNAELETQQTRETELAAAVEDAQQAADFTELQLKNRELTLQTLSEREDPLVAVQQFYYNQAQQHRQRIWRNIGGQYVYNAVEAKAYRDNLQKASIAAEERNQVWARIQETEAEIAELKPKLAEKQAELAQQTAELEAVQNAIAPLNQRQTELEEAIAPIVERLQPLQTQEKAQIEAFQTATRTAKTSLKNLGDTLSEQVEALNRLISFGLLASEADLDLFPNQIAPQVEQYIKLFQERDVELETERDRLQQLLAGWQTERATLTDDASIAAIDALIADTIAQIETLNELKAATKDAATGLRDRLDTATTALEKLRQRQELTVREQLDGNSDRLASLQSQLLVEEAAKNALDDDTILGYAQLNDRARQDLYDAALHWTQQLQEGHTQTRSRGEDQEALSSAVDALLDRIETEFAEPHGDLTQTRANLRDALQTLGVVAPRQDEIREGIGFVEDEIEQLKLTLAQDKALWEEIAPIVDRYEAEAKAVEEYETQLATLAELQDKLKPVVELYKAADLKEEEAVALDAKIEAAKKRADDYHNHLYNYRLYGIKKYHRNSQNLHFYAGLVNNWRSLKNSKAQLLQEAKDIREQQTMPFLHPVMEWVEDNDILNIAREILDKQQENSQYAEELEALQQHITEYDRLKADYDASQAKADTTRQNWADAIDYDPDKIARTEFNGTLVEAVRADDNHTYTRYSTDGGDTWNSWTINNLYSKEDDIKFAEVDGKLFQFVRHPDNVVYARNSADGQTWLGWSSLGVGTVGEFNVDTIGDRAVVSMRQGGTYNRVYTRAIHADRWEPLNYAPVTSLDDVQQEVIGDRLIQSFKGVDGKTYLRHTEDGVNWTDWESPESAIAQSDWRLENLPEVRDESLIQHSDRVTQAKFGDKLIEVVTSENDLIYQRYSEDDGETWTEWGRIQGGVNGKIELFDMGDRLFQVAQDDNGTIWLRSSTNGTGWPYWYRVSGAGNQDFSVDRIGNHIVMSWRGSDNKFYRRQLNERGAWSGYDWSNIQTLGDVSQEKIGDRLVQTYRGVDDKLYTRETNDGVTWTDWQISGTSQEFSHDELVETQIGDRLVQLVPGANRQLFSRVSTTNGSTWSDWKPTTGYLKAGEELETIVHNDALYHTFKATNNRVYILRSTDGEAWTSSQLSSGPNGKLLVTAVGDRLVANVRGNNDHRSYVRSLSPDGKSWTGWQAATPQITGDIYQETVDGKLVQVYRGMDDRLMTRHTEDGETWTDWETFEDAIAANDWRKTYLENLDPAVTLEAPIARHEFDGKLVETTVTNGYVYGRHSEDNGETWTDWRYTYGRVIDGEVQVLEMGDRLIQIARTPNGTTYTRSSVDGINWPSRWTHISNATVGDMQIDTIGDQLVFTWRHTDNRLRTVQMTNGVSWSVNDWSPTQTLDDFSQEVRNGQLVQSYQGTDGKKYVRHTADGKDWSDWTPVEAALDQAQWRHDEVPAVAIDTANLDLENVETTLFEEVKIQTVIDKDGYVYRRTSSDNGVTWTDWTYAKMRAKEGEAVKTLQVGDRVFQFWKHPDNTVYLYDSADGINWRYRGAIGGPSAGDYNVDVVGDDIVFSMRYWHNNKVYTRTINPVGASNWNIATVPTIANIDQSVTDGVITQTYVGTDNSVYTRESSDGTNWTIRNTSEQAQNLGLDNVETTIFNGVKVQTVIEPRGYAYRRTSSDNGATWTDCTYAGMHVKEGETVKTVKAGDRLFQFWQATDNTIYAVDSLDGITWRGRGRIAGVPEGNYNLDVIGDEIVFSMHHASDDKVYTRTISSVNASGWNVAPIATLDDIKQAVTDGVITQTYLGTDNNVYTRTSTDGTTWTEWYSEDITARNLRTEKESHLVPIVDNSKTLLRPTFVDHNDANGSAIALLQEEIGKHHSTYQQQLSEATAEKIQTDAQNAAVIAQAKWYEDQAAKHWELSRKNGPFWYEWRKTWRRGSSGKKKKKWVRITHIDHHWILWNTYTKYAQQLREQGISGILDRNAATREEERLIPLANQWSDANNAANNAAPAISVTRNLIEVLEAAREQLPKSVEQLDLLKEILPDELREELKTNQADIELMNPDELVDLLPDLRAALELAERDTETYTEKVNNGWNDYDTAREDYKAAIDAILNQKGQIQQQAQTLQHDLADSEAWVERQSLALSDELVQVKALQQQLTNNAIALETSTQPDDKTKLAQLQEAIAALDNKATLLSAQQAALTQKRTLLAAQNEVILAEQALISAYLESPDADLSQLQEQLADARAALAEAQRLAEQAEASSKALTSPLQELQADLLAQDDEHLAAAKEHQTLLKELLEATELNANYSLEAAQKQQEVNDLEFQIQQRLQEMAAAGLEEAKHLLDVATHNDMATAAALYYRDYRDLTTDTGGSCSGGIARQSDFILANHYYVQMLKHRQLQHRARAQANHFKAIKDAAEAAKNDLEARQQVLSDRLAELNNSIATTEEEKAEKEQALAIARARLDAVSALRDRTEQTFVQLVTIEQLNLGQAQLEREIASQRQAEIEAAVEARLERERIELERQRLAAQAKLEQLRQLQAEDDLRDALNEARGDLGLDELDSDFDPAQSQALMAALATQIDQFAQTSVQLPESTRSTLEATRAALSDALSGQVEQVSRDNLTEALATLLLEGNRFRSELDSIYQETRADAELLELAENNLIAAARKLQASVNDTNLLAAEREILMGPASETIARVALAENAVEISFELARESWKVLEKILEIRKAEREAREKAFWAELVGILQMVVGIIGLLFPKLKLITTLISAAIGAIWSAINGDWLGAIFSVVMAAAKSFSQYLGKLLKAGCTCITLLGKQVARSTVEALKRSLDAFQKLGKGVYKGIKSIQSGDDVKGILQFVQSVASAVVTGLSGNEDFNIADTQFKTDLLALPGGQQIWGILDALQTAPVAILNAIRALEKGQTFDGINQILGQVFQIGGKVTSGVLNSAFSVLDMANDTAGVIVNKFVREGGVWGWLEGIGQISTIWKDIPKAIEAATKDLKAAQDCNCETEPTLLGDFLGRIVDAAKLQSLAEKVGAFSNAVENVTYTGLAFAKAVEGATKGFKEFINSLNDVGSYLKKGWGDDLKAMKEDKNSAYSQLLKHLKTIGDIFGEAGEELLDLDIHEAYKRAKDGFDKFLSRTTNSGIWATFKELLKTLEPLIFSFP